MIASCLGPWGVRPLLRGSRGMERLQPYLQLTRAHVKLGLVESDPEKRGERVTSLPAGGHAGGPKALTP